MERIINKGCDNIKIGIIDADLLDKGTRHPNLALLKISGYYKSLGNDTKLLLDYNDINTYDKVFLSCVFDFTKIPININDYPNLITGGTGIYWDKSPQLDQVIEHHMPDYSLYDEFIENEIARGMKPSNYKDYKDFSIGFTTRYCIRKCPFCINHDKNKVEKHSLVSEFFDPTRKYIYLWDDNFLASPHWREILDELEQTKRYIQFRQGLDIRLMTEEKAMRLSKVKYYKDYIFAFDDINDTDIIVEKLRLWKKHCKKTTKLYVFCGFDRNGKYDDEFWKQDIKDTFERIKILMKLGCIPYIMRHENYNNSPYRGVYITLARWCNQPAYFKKESLREYVWITDSIGREDKIHAAKRYLMQFETDYPEIAKEYYDIKYEELNEYINIK